MSDGFAYHQPYVSDTPDWSQYAPEIPAACREQMAALRARFAAEQAQEKRKTAAVRLLVLGEAVLPKAKVAGWLLPVQI